MATLCGCAAMLLLAYWARRIPDMRRAFTLSAVVNLLGLFDTTLAWLVFLGALFFLPLPRRG